MLKLLDNAWPHHKRPLVQQDQHYQNILKVGGVLKDHHKLLKWKQLKYEHYFLKLFLKNNARILIASTSEIYGDPLVHPQPEEYFGNVDPVGPRGVYDEAKRFQEALTTAYHTFHGLDIRIARIFNTYGSRMRVNDGRAIPAFM